MVLGATLLAGCATSGAPGGAFGVRSADPIDAEDGFVTETSTEVLAYYRRQTTVCRRQTARGAEVCLTDERFAGQPIFSSRSWDSKLVVGSGGLNGDGRADVGKGLLLDFDSQTVRQLDGPSGSAVALSPGGDRMLWYDQMTWALTVSRVDGSSAQPVESATQAFGGRWVDDDILWLTAGSELTVHRTGSGRDTMTVRVDEPGLLLWLETYADLDMAVAWDATSAAKLEFGSGSIVVVDMELGRTIPIPAPADVDWPLAAGLAPDGSYLLIIWERSPGPVLELHVVTIDRPAGLAGPTRLVHRFDNLDPVESHVLEMTPFPAPGRIAIGENGALTWFTNSAVLTADVGRLPS